MHICLTLRLRSGNREHLTMTESKSIILTGASRGIGLAIARFLLKDGHKVFLVARTEEPLLKLKSEFKGQVEFLAADLSDFEVSVLPWISFGILCFLSLTSCFSVSCTVVSKLRVVSLLLISPFAHWQLFDTQTTLLFLPILLSSFPLQLCTSRS